MKRERRRYLRVPVELRVETSILDPAGLPLKTFEARATDVSAGGVRLVLPEPLWVGCSLRLHLVHDHPRLDLPLLGSVVRTERLEGSAHGAGIEFVAVSGPERIALTRFVLALARSTGHGNRRILDQA